MSTSQSSHPLSTLELSIKDNHVVMGWMLDETRCEVKMTSDLAIRTGARILWLALKSIFVNRNKPLVGCRKENQPEST